LCTLSLQWCSFPLHTRCFALFVLRHVLLWLKTFVNNLLKESPHFPICPQSDIRSTLKYEGGRVNKPTYCLLKAKKLKKQGHLYHIRDTQSWKVFVRSLQDQCIKLAQTTPTGLRLSARVVRNKLKLTSPETQGASALSSF